MIEYTLCNDEDIWAEIEQEAIQSQEKAKNPKPLIVPAPQLKDKLNTFLLDTFQNFWSYNQEQLDLAKKNLRPEMVSLASINWGQRKQDTDSSKSGQYTLNPETQNLNFEKAKVFIPDPKTLKGFEGKSLAELGQYLHTKYGSEYYIPGIEYWEYISKNPDKAPQPLKDTGNYYFYFGSIVRYQDGYWYVPYSNWDTSSFNRNANWLDNTWISYYRVVLLVTPSYFPT